MFSGGWFRVTDLRFRLAVGVSGDCALPDVSWPAVVTGAAGCKLGSSVGPGCGAVCGRGAAMSEGLRFRLAEGEELCERKARRQRTGLGNSDFARRGEGKCLLRRHSRHGGRGAVLTWTRRAATQDSFTGGIGCSYTACCHARIMQAFGSHLRGTTASVKTVDDHDIGVGRRPVGASADQVQGIQTVRFTGWRANGRIAAARVWRTANML
jgi:hypothetical protein